MSSSTSILKVKLILNMNDYGHWTVNFKDFNQSEWHGFIYLITEVPTGRTYIGKKVFRHKRSLPPLKGKVNRRIKWKESDWKTYTGSSSELNLNMKHRGKEQYTFEILSLHETKASLTYKEIEMMIVRDALRDRNCYNKWFGACKFIPPQETEKELTHRVY